MDIGSSPLRVWWRMKESWVGCQRCGTGGTGIGGITGSSEVECDEDGVERPVLVVVVLVVRGMLWLCFGIAGSAGLGWLLLEEIESWRGMDGGRTGQTAVVLVQGACAYEMPLLCEFRGVVAVV